ncbi:NAD(P)-binding protein, partial [Xylona heveae TC161]
MASTFTKTYHHTSYPSIDPSREALSVAGKTVLITGGGTGIGRETTKAFAQAGAPHIALLGRRSAPLEETKKIVEGTTATKVHVYVVNVTDHASVEAAFASFASATKQPIDIVINNAGYLSNPSPIKSSDVADWWLGFEINVKGALNIAQAFAKHAAAQGAVFIQVSTAAAHRGLYPGFSAYSSSKIAVSRVIEYLQAETPDATVLSIHPGVVKTDMSAKTGIDFPADLLDDGMSFFFSFFPSFHPFHSFLPFDLPNIYSSHRIYLI